MSLFCSFLTAILCLGAPNQGSVHAEAVIPALWVLGEAFEVQVTYAAGPAGAYLQAWQLTAAAFEVDGQALAERGNEATIPLAAGDSIILKLDLAKSWLPDASFELGLSTSAQAARTVRCFETLAESVDFMSMDAAALAGLQVLMSTLHGDLLFELWPDVAVNHVRNWLDLVHSHFYDGLQFHRVSPVFMIQGGCPNTRTDRRDRWGLGVGPRQLKLELSARKHERGVLSMARGEEPDSASSQFFVITRDSPQLDGQYSSFGRLQSGFDVLAEIANAEGRVKDGTITPERPQRIQKASVLRELQAKR